MACASAKHADPADHSGWSLRRGGCLPWQRRARIQSGARSCGRGGQTNSKEQQSRWWWCWSVSVVLRPHPRPTRSSQRAVCGLHERFVWRLCSGRPLPRLECVRLCGAAARRTYTAKGATPAAAALWHAARWAHRRHGRGGGAARVDAAGRVGRYAAKPVAWTARGLARRQRARHYQRGIESR